jgi:chemotaxis signal transduction protein
VRSPQGTFPDSSSGAGRALALRRAFDQSFGEVALVDRTPLDDLLAIRVGDRPFALRLSEVAGLFVDRAVTRLPTTVPELLGVMTVRGALVPVYDLAALLGWPGSTRARWLVIAAGTRVGLAFDQLDGHLRIQRQAITTPVAASDGEAHASRHVQEIAQLEDGRRPIISLPSVLDAIASRVRPAPSGGDASWGGSDSR